VTHPEQARQSDNEIAATPPSDLVPEIWVVVIDDDF
jgi:hypothetical protein